MNGGTLPKGGRCGAADGGDGVRGGSCLAKCHQPFRGGPLTGYAGGARQRHSPTRWLAAPTTRGAMFGHVLDKTKISITVLGPEVQHYRETEGNRGDRQEQDRGSNPEPLRVSRLHVGPEAGAVINQAPVAQSRKRSSTPFCPAPARLCREILRYPGNRQVALVRRNEPGINGVIGGAYRNRTGESWSCTPWPCL